MAKALFCRRRTRSIPGDGEVWALNFACSSGRVGLGPARSYVRPSFATGRRRRSARAREHEPRAARSGGNASSSFVVLLSLYFGYSSRCVDSVYACVLVCLDDNGYFVSIVFRAFVIRYLYCYSQCKITRKEDIRELFVPRFYFGCEADDPINAWPSTAGQPAERAPQRDLQFGHRSHGRPRHDRGAAEPTSWSSTNY